MAYIKKEPIIEFITKGLNNPDKSKAYGYDAIEILSEIEYAPTADVVPRSEIESLQAQIAQEVVRCKDCIYFQPEFVLTNDGERRPYTEQEIKNGKIVSMDVGINCGSRCERFGYWEENKIPVWFEENDFCSYGKRAEKERKKEDGNA